VALRIPPNSTRRRRRERAGSGGRADWDWFTYDGRSTNMGVTALTFYALTGDARFRLELNTSFKSDIISDLYWSINMFESFNSLPPTGQKKNDFGISGGDWMEFLVKAEFAFCLRTSALTYKLRVLA
jgi:hypothetical protein